MTYFEFRLRKVADPSPSNIATINMSADFPGAEQIPPDGWIVSSSWITEDLDPGVGDSLSIWMSLSDESSLSCLASISTLRAMRR